MNKADADQRTVTFQETHFLHCAQSSFTDPDHVRYFLITPQHTGEIYLPEGPKQTSLNRCVRYWERFSLMLCVLFPPGEKLGFPASSQKGQGRTSTDSKTAKLTWRLTVPQRALHTVGIVMQSCLEAPAVLTLPSVLQIGPIPSLKSKCKKEI